MCFVLQNALGKGDAALSRCIPSGSCEIALEVILLRDSSRQCIIFLVAIARKKGWDRVMVYAFCASMLLYLAYVAYKLRYRKLPNNISGFFSFDNNVTPQSLRDAFFVTNASFATAFVTLFLYVGSQGVLSIVTPVSFFIGSIFFTYYLLPRSVELMSSGKRYPELLGQLTESRTVRIISSVYVVISLWLFTYVEIHGFLSFVREKANSFYSPVWPFIMAIPILVFMGAYTAASGFSGVVSSDRVQRILISAGAISFVLIAIISLNALDQQAITGAGRYFLSFATQSSFPFIMEAFVGFLFSQILYYDNWQRISAYALIRRQADVGDEEIIKEIKRCYSTGAAWLLVLYMVPVLMGFAAVSNGMPVSDISSLVGLIQNIWEKGWIEKLLLFVCFLYLSAALISTMEVYSISIVNNILDDISGIMHSYNKGSEQDTRLLPIARYISFFVCLTFLPFLLINPDFEKMFLFLFYSANGFVGPIVCLLMKRKLKPVGVYFSLAFCVGWCSLALWFPEKTHNFSYPGFLTVAGSLLLCWCFSDKKRLVENL